MEEHLVTFKLGSEEFGVDIMQVQEIIKIPPITLVPRAPKYVEGVINLRGNVIPVLNLKRRFEIVNPDESQDSRIIVIQVQGRITGIMVDQVVEVLHLSIKDIEPPPPVTSGNEPGYIRGVGKVGERLVELLEVDKIIDSNYMERKVG